MTNIWRKPFAVLPFKRLRVLQPNLDGEIRCCGFAIRIDPVLSGQLEQVVVLFGRSGMLDEVQPLDQFGRHLLIGFGENASLPVSVGRSISPPSRDGSESPLVAKKRA